MNDSSINPNSLKASSELAYWRRQELREGNIAENNLYYEEFFTSHFNLAREFYAGKKVLDIGCGPRGSLEWMTMAQERVGLDPLADSYRELGTAKHRMQYVAAGSESIPFPDNYFDCVSSFNSLDHVDDLDRTISEIIRVLKSGGTFLLLTDVNHEPTACEPIVFSFDVTKKFQPALLLLDEGHFEKRAGGMYSSLREGVAYDHADARRRYGILSGRFGKG
jgi:ubiquinone/menaquinone biosynthesis C-methylase UbiE